MKYYTVSKSNKKALYLQREKYLRMLLLNE